MSYETITVEQPPEGNGAVTLITLNRPQALNALSSKVLEELIAAFAAYEADPSQLCAVITGAGDKAFAAGADIKEMSEKAAADFYLEDFFAGWTSEIVYKTRKPWIAAVNGFALGGGCELAMMADFIIASENAKFGQPEIKLGVAPGMGGSQRLTRAVGKGIFGTKMRSVIHAANAEGIAANVAQQFEIGHQILSHGLVPIIEPEVTITISDKAEAEDILLAEITKQLDTVPADQQVMLKLTLPEKANQYKSLVDHPRVMRVVALSGGYSREEANDRLCQNTGIIASFSRALTEGLSAKQSDADFDAMLAGTIESIYDASCAG